MLLDIATGSSRKQMTWHNRQLAWNDLATKLSKTHRTAEAYAAYVAADKARQDEIKDIGGFVGGYLNEGKRRKAAVRHRQLLTLDVDFATGTFWEDFRFQYAEAALIYSTHKHSPDSPRLRLVMPLSRKVTAEEYEALGRKIAGMLGIELFDPTTFQPERLMYWPSTAKDGDWVFERQDGNWLDVDATLGQYVDWRDVSAWPRTEKDRIAIDRDGKKLGNPTEKPGTIGAFCRAYDIHSAIAEFLPDTYEATDQKDRYTYAEGSTSHGAVVYNEGAFLFSHHSTDPIHGQLVNAFDLVRLHRFGDLDSEKDLAKPIHEHPSYIAMCELAVVDGNVVKELDEFKKPIEAALKLAKKEKPAEPKKETKKPEKPEKPEVDEVEDEDWSSSAEDDFADLFEIGMGLDMSDPADDGVTEDNWRRKLSRHKKTGKVEPTISNLKLIMLFDPELKGTIALNEFENFIYIVARVPWDEKWTAPVRWKDSDDSGLREYLETRYGIYHVGKVQDAIVLAAVFNKYHPVREFLDGLEWDGVQRLDRLFVDYLGAENTPYTRAVTRKAFAAAVARVYRPGCKFDYVPVLVGPEGIKKSGLLTEMGYPWFSDSFQTVTGKEAYEQLQGSWIVEIAELSAFNRAETNAIKAFVTKRTDKYRAAYGKHVTEWPRQSVFFATTNEQTFLKGHTGNRRFWPVAVTKKHEPTAKQVNASVPGGREVIVGLPVEQLWAEAKHYYKEGEPLYLNDAKIELEAKKMQDEYSEVDERLGMVMKFLDTKLPENWDKMCREERRSYLYDGDEIKAKGVDTRDYACPMEVWCEALGMRLQDFNPAKGRELRGIMAMVPGWRPVASLRTFPLYGRQRFYERIDKKVMAEG